MSYGTNAPQGLVPVRYRDGSPWNGATNQYNIASAYGTNLFTNDPVKMLSDGTIGIGTAGATCRGVFQGTKYTSNLGVFTFSPFWPASTSVLTGTTAIALIADTPNMVFNIQEAATNTGVGTGTAGTPLALADRGLNINFKAPTTGITATGQSAYFIDNATENTTPTLNLKILDLDPDPSNVVGAYANWLCAWNVHDFLSVGTDGV